MLSDELRNAFRQVRYEIAGGTCTLDIWLIFCDRIEDIAERIEAYERSAGPGPGARLDPDNLPEGVVPLHLEPPA